MIENIEIPAIEENIFTISVPIKVNRRRDKTATMILPKNIPQDENNSHYDYILIKVFAKSYKWQQDLKKDPLMTYETIAYLI